MVLKAEQKRIKHLLEETIPLLCKSGLEFKSEFCIEVFVGITLDQDEMIHFSLRETFKNNKGILEEQNQDLDEDEEIEGIVLDDDDYDDENDGPSSAKYPRRESPKTDLVRVGDIRGSPSRKRPARRNTPPLAEAEDSNEVSNLEHEDSTNELQTTEFLLNSESDTATWLEKSKTESDLLPSCAQESGNSSDRLLDAQETKEDILSSRECERLLGDSTSGVERLVGDPSSVSSDRLIGDSNSSSNLAEARIKEEVDDDIIVIKEEPMEMSMCGDRTEDALLSLQHPDLHGGFGSGYMEPHPGVSFQCQTALSETMGSNTDTMNMTHASTSSSYQSYDQGSYNIAMQQSGPTETRREGELNMDLASGAPICTICGSTFFNMSSLRRHLRSARVHGSQNTYPCTICLKSYRRLDHLKVHIKKIHPNQPST